MMSKQYTMVRLFLILLFLAVDVAKGQGNDPCLTATLIHDDKRYVNYSKTNDLCDRVLTAGFYRFDNAEIPFTDGCIGNYHCGTHLPMWIQGTNYPSVSDGLQTRHACYDLVPNDNNCCDKQKEVVVKNCGTYFVYYLLPADGCSMAYCIDKSPKCSGSKYSATGFPPCMDAYPILTSNPSLSNPIVTNNDFKFGCHIPYPSNKNDATFEVTWLIDGKQVQSIPKQTISGGQREVTLYGGTLYGHINKVLSCSVVSTFTDGHTGGVKSPPRESNTYFVGVKVNHNTINVGSSLPDKEIVVTSTIPIVCRHQAGQNCSLMFTVTTDNENISPSTCHVTLKPTDWNPVTNTAKTSFFITTSPSFSVTSSFISSAHLNVSTVPGWEWTGLKMPEITVVGSSGKQGAHCQSVGDPHYFTFDNHVKKYSNFHVGQFTMVKTTKSSFKVETRTWRKPGGKPSFNCAVAAREGNDVIIVDMCDGPYGKTYPKLKIANPKMFENKTEIVKDQSGNTIVIKFSSGAIVKVLKRSNRLAKLELRLDVFISVPGAFAGDTKGLCGTFDGKSNNDLQHPNGHIDAFSIYPYSFIDSWRIPKGQSLFEKAEPLPAINTRKDYCTCNKQTNKQECNNTPSSLPPISAFCTGCAYVDPEPPSPSTPASVWVTPQPPVPQTTYMFPPPTQPSQQAPFISKPDAMRSCFDLLYKYPSAKKCINGVYQMSYMEILDMCVTDIELTGDKDMGLSSLTAMMEGCGFQSLISTNNIVNGTFVTPPDAKVCPGACSGNGECHNGVCACAKEFESSDCSVNKTQAPTITDIYGGSACDVQSVADCYKPIMLGRNMNHNSTTCNMRTIHSSTFGSSTVDLSATTIKTEYMSTNHLACGLPKDHNSNGNNMAVQGFMMSLTNHGTTEGNTHAYYIFDSKCMKCDQQGSCAVKPDSCMIENKCYVYGDQDKLDFQGWCIPAVNNLQWTKQTPSTTASTTTTTSSPLSTQVSQSTASGLNNYTAVGTGCGCYFDTSHMDCACCKNFGCPCDASSRHVCFDCMNPNMCHK